MYTYTGIDYNPFKDNEIAKVSLMNDSQKEIWLSCMLGGDKASLAYNESISLELKGSLDISILEASLSALVAQHEALRCVVSANGETLLISKEIPVLLNEINLMSSTTAAQEIAFSEFIKQEMNRPFDLYQGPLFRFFLHILQPDIYRFTIIVHHIIADGWSLGVMIDDLSKFYNASKTGSQYPQRSIPQMSDYALSQRTFKSSPEFSITKEYWHRKFENDIPVLQIPIDLPRVNPRTYRGNRIDFELPENLLFAIQKTSSQTNTSLVITLLCAFEIFLKKLSIQKDIIIGLPVAGQLANDNMGLVSHCVNLLPIKSSLLENETPIYYLSRRKKEILDDLDHQHITFSEILKDISIERNQSNVPLVSAIFNVDLGMDEGVTFTDLKHRLFSNPRQFENFDIFLNLSGNHKHLVCEWSFNTDVFLEDTITRYHNLYLDAIHTLINKPADAIQLARLSPVQVQSPSLNGNGLNQERDLIKRFEQSVTQYHANIAVVFGEERLSYGNLNHKINQLAAYLRRKGVKEGDRIGLSTDRSIEILIAMMALIKTGAIFIPIDSKYPKDRKKLLLENIQPSFIITSKKHRSTVLDEYGDFTEYFIEDMLNLSQSFPTEDVSVTLSSNRSIYILHTSGSTGVPKGVSMNQPALANIFQWQTEQSNADQHSATLQFSPLNFDVSFQEIFSTFFTGGTLVLVGDTVRLDPSRLLSYLEDHHINRLFLPFVALQSLVELADARNQFPSSLQEVITAGEQLKVTPQVRRFFTALPGCKLYNHYGPTETHIVTSLKLDGDPANWPALPSIGKEIDHTAHFILDDQLKEVAQGEVGELCLSGICLADGYVNQASFTAERFPNWLHPEKGLIRIYRSGDLAKRLPDGNIEFLGRIDQQIKIRGFRVELSEIEYYLNQENEIKQSVVIAEKNDYTGNVRLMGYVTTDTAVEVHPKEDVSWEERWEALYKNAESEQAKHTESNLDDLVFKQLGHFEDADKHATEWLDNTLERIQEIIDKQGNKKKLKILEIGCGGGQLLYPLATQSATYYASDISETAIKNIQGRIDQDPEKWKNVIVSASDASDLSFLKGVQVDLIIINSVTQYFPNEQYLINLIEKSIQFLHPEGCLFLGDVQASETLERCLIAEQLPHTKDSTTLEQFKKIIDNRILSNDELVVDPSFFYSLRAQIPAISHVDVQIRKGIFINETTKYHYDTWIYKDPAILYAQPDRVVDWKDLHSLHVLQETLALHPNECFQVQHIPNRRCLYDVTVLESIEALTADTSISTLKSTIDLQKTSGEDPDNFWKIGDNLGFDTYVRWMNSGIDNQMEVIYIPSNSPIKACPPLQNLQGDIANFQSKKHIQILQSETLERKCSLWRDKLKEKLPDYMIPDRIVVINQIPLTSTGKIDRKELPQVSQTSVLSDQASLPQNDIEHFLEKLWCKLLSLEQISTQSDFFDIGGHSLLAVKVIIAIEKKYEIKLPLATLFDYSSIEKLALKIQESIEGKQGENVIEWNALVPIKRSGSYLPVYMIHGAGLNVLLFKSFVRYLDPEQPVYGMQALGQNGKSAISEDIHEIAAKYNEDILKNDPHGPYLLGGYSYGGFLAFEMARQLTAMGKEVKMLAIFDTYVDEFDTAATSVKNMGNKFKFILKTIIQNPVRYFSYTLFMARMKLKYTFNKNHIDHVETYSHRTDIVGAYIKAFKNYKMTPQAIEISLFKAKHHLQYYEDATYMGWSNFADKVSIHEIPGEHKTIFYPPNDRGLAKVFQAVMKEKNQ